MTPCQPHAQARHATQYVTRSHQEESTPSVEPVVVAPVGVGSPSPAEVEAAAEAGQFWIVAQPEPVEATSKPYSPLTPENEKVTTSSTSPAVSTPAAAHEDPFALSTADIKAALLDSLYGTGRGLSARSEVRAEINELISQLEAKNPTPNPTEVMGLLGGTWQLAYTCNSGLNGVLALGKLPLVTVGDITQTIDTVAMTVENQVNLSGPLASTSLKTTASYEVRSPKRLQLKLERGQVSTPVLIGDLVLPSEATILGQSIDLTQLQQALAPVEENIKGVFESLNSLLSQAPGLDVPLESKEAVTWQLNTYVDEDVRITRGDRGAVFLYTKSPTTAEL